MEMILPEIPVIASILDLVLGLGPDLLTDPLFQVSMIFLIS